MDLSRFIYDFNLFSTQTVADIYEGCSIINNGRAKEINYGNCVSLYDVVERFNKSYLDFLKDSCQFREIIGSLGEDVSYALHSASDDFISLCLDVSKPRFDIFDDEYAVVYFVNKCGNFYAFANNGRRIFDEGYKCNTANVDSDSVCNCLNVVKNNNLFLEAYKDLKSKFIFGNGTTVIFSKIGGSLLGELSTFTLTFGNSYMNSTDFIEVKFRLGESLEILYDESKVEIGDEEITDMDKKRKIIKELLSSIYVNSDKLNGLYKNNDSEKVYMKEDK